MQKSLNLLRSELQSIVERQIPAAKLEIDNRQKSLADCIQQLAELQERAADVTTAIARLESPAEAFVPLVASAAASITAKPQPRKK